MLTYTYTTYRKAITIPCLPKRECLDDFLSGKLDPVRTITFPVDEIQNITTWRSKQHNCRIGIIDCNTEVKEHVWGRNYYVTEEMIGDALSDTIFANAFFEFKSEKQEDNDEGH